MPSCPRCQRPVALARATCLYCGAALPSPAAAALPEPEPAPAPPATRALLILDLEQAEPGPLARVLSRFFTLPPERTLVLDRDGSDVWRWADGRTRVREIASRLAAAHGWPEERARDAVVRFLGMLSERRLVGFQVPPGAEAS